MQLRSLPADPTPVAEARGDLVFLFPAKTRWLALLKLVNPAAWFMPMWAMFCGMMTNEGLFHPSRAILIALALFAIGPLQGIFFGYAKAFFARDTETLRSPDRTHTSPNNSLDLTVSAMLFTLLGIVLCGYWLGPLPFVLLITSLMLGALREIFPIPFRPQGSNPLIGALVSVGIPWFIGEALFSSFSSASLLPAVIFTFGYIGLDILLDISQIEKGRIVENHALGAVLGNNLGMWLAAFVIDTALLGAAILCIGSATAVFILTILLVQVLMQGVVIRYGRPDWYFPIASVLFALGMMLAATTGHIPMIQL